ncbi:MAG: HD domain-containing protein [Deltaproteobacteria bacterium]|nr:HD domain-containing protein [Deltaproteobacteria bacterium]MBW2399140.1 HD domain-containing protein [Deltaproteobacteria bacterium]MBW2666586.1 HD domain-containing protein [Deltaproteobacteria bacterium]
MDSHAQARLVEATELAHRWHASQFRKGSQIPYISHLLQVQGLVLEHGGDAEQAVAALLHDSLEDAETPAEARDRAEEIETRFGAGALAIVRDCSDTGKDEAGATKGPWRERKQRYHAQLAAASERSLLVAACDKLHNLNALVWDIETQGVETLDRFNAGPVEQLWYFDGLAAHFEGRVPARLQNELTALLERFRGLVG